MTDPFGRAIEDFHQNGQADDIQVDTNYTEGERIHPAYFFRSYTEMPELEKQALKHCTGKVLDVGSAAGSHALILQEQGIDVTALEISHTACKVMQERGIKRIVPTDILDFSGERFDTILLLMNGTGIGKTLLGLEALLIHLRSLLEPSGQILLDSSDIKYLFEEEDGSYWVDLASDTYYGEMLYEVRYKNLRDRFNWLFTDFNTLMEVASRAGFICSKLASGTHFDFLARLSVTGD